MCVYELCMTMQESNLKSLLQQQNFPRIESPEYAIFIKLPEFSRFLTPHTPPPSSDAPDCRNKYLLFKVQVYAC